MTTRTRASRFFGCNAYLISRVSAIVPISANTDGVSSSSDQRVKSPRPQAHRVASDDEGLSVARGSISAMTPPQPHQSFFHELCEQTFPGLRSMVFSRLAAFAGIAFFSLVSLTNADDQKLSSVRVGYQKYGTLNVLKAEGSLRNR